VVDGRRARQRDDFGSVGSEQQIVQSELDVFATCLLLRGVGQSTGQVVDFIDYDKGIVKGVDSVIFCKFIEALRGQTIVTHDTVPLSDAQ
jgi:hypothetical protein